MSDVDAVLLEGYLEGSLAADQREQLAKRLAADPRLLAEFAADVSDARALEAALGRNDDAAVLSAIRQILEAGRGASRAIARVRQQPIPLQPRRSRAWWLAAAAGIAAVVTIAVRWSADAGTGITLIAANQAAIIVEGHRQDAVARMTIPVSARIESSAGGSVRWSYRDGTEIGLAGAATASLSESAAGKSIDLASGSLDAAVAKQPAGAPLTIRSPHAVTTVVGTRLRVDADGASTRVRVDEGRVRVASSATAHDEETSVEAGGWAVIDDVGLARGDAGEPARTRFAYAGAREPIPTWLRFATLVDCPARPDGLTRCLEATKADGNAGMNIFADGQPLITMADDLVISFDYRCDASVTWIGIWMKDATSDSEQQASVTIAADTWQHADMPLSSLRPIGAVKRNLAVGDVITNVRLQAMPGSGTLWIANLRLRAVPGTLPKTNFRFAP